MASKRPYDLFVSYAKADEAWVMGTLIYNLARSGVSVHREDDFTAGVPQLDEFERAIEESTRTLLVLSPDYLAGGRERFIKSLAQSEALFNREEFNVIPLR